MSIQASGMARAYERGRKHIQQLIKVQRATATGQPACQWRVPGEHGQEQCGAPATHRHNSIATMFYCDRHAVPNKSHRLSNAGDKI